jgi:hypothetical protein
MDAQKKAPEHKANHRPDVIFFVLRI